MLRISINKDIEKYESGILFGLSLKEIIFVVIGIALGSILITFLSSIVGVIFAVYLSSLIVAPIGLLAFFNRDGMDLYTFIKKTISFKKNNHKYQKSTIHNIDLIRSITVENISNKSEFNVRLKREIVKLTIVLLVIIAITSIVILNS